MNQLNVDLQAILHAGNAFEHIHAQVWRLLAKCDNLMKYPWEGPAGEQTKEAYRAFLGKYVNLYLQMIRNYQHFLQNTAAAGYGKTQEHNVKLANLVCQSIGTCPADDASGLREQTRNVVTDWVLKLK
ncbi:MAG: hypothetical protein ACI4MK_02825 [Aristaeellaceae bacterium]